MREKLPENKARQGRTGFPVLIVLIAGLILAAIAWWGAEIYGRCHRRVAAGGDTRI